MARTKHNSRSIASKHLTTLQRAIFILVSLFPLFYIMGNAATEIAICIIAILFLSQCVSSKYISWVKQPYLVFSVLFWLTISIKSITIESYHTSLLRSIAFIRYPLFAMAVQYILSTHPNHKILMRSIVFSLCFASCNAIVQYFVGFNLFAMPYNDHGHFIKLTSLLGKKMNIGATICFISPIAISYCLLLISDKKSDYIAISKAIFITLIITIAVFLSGERMAFVLLLFGIFCLALLQRQSLRTRHIIAIFAIICISLAFSKNTLINRYYKNAISIQSTPPLASPYGIIYSISLNMFLQNPISGIGIKQYRKECHNSKYHHMQLTQLQLLDACMGHPHNIYLELMAETGLMGLTLFLAFIYYILRHTMLHITQIRKNAVFAGAIVMLLIKTWPIAPSGSIFAAWAGSTIWFSSGILLSLKEKNKQNPLL